MNKENWAWKENLNMSEEEKKVFEKEKEATKKAINKHIKENPDFLEDVESQNRDVILSLKFKEKLKEFKQEIENLNKKMGDLIIKIDSSETNKEDIPKIEIEIQDIIMQIEDNEKNIKEIKNVLQKAVRETSESSRN